MHKRELRTYDVTEDQPLQYHTHHKTSKPLLAVTRSGICSVCSGSTIPSMGRRARLAIPVIMERQRERDRQTDRQTETERERERERESKYEVILLLWIIVQNHPPVLAFSGS